MPKYFTERGKDHDEVLEKINRKYGTRARILMYKTVPCTGLKGLFGKEEVEYSCYIASGAEANLIQKGKDAENRDAILKSTGKFHLKQSIGEEKTDQRPSMSDLITEIREIKEHIATSVPPEASEEYKVIQELGTILLDNEFTDSYVDRLIEGMKSRLNLADLENRELVHKTAVKIIAEDLNFYKWDKSEKIFVVVGPTGVGKTTTIAKLAAVHGLGVEHLDVRIINIDSFRIGAQSQVETYGTIMGVNVVSVDQYDELRKQIALATDADMILVDTIGKSPGDSVKLAQMKKLLSGCGEDAVFHLAISATTKLSDMAAIIEQFEPFNYKSILITKMDETLMAGGIISLLAERNIAVSYITDGQSVPVDIAIASPARLLSRIRGLEFNVQSMEDDSRDITALWR